MTDPIADMLTRIRNGYLAGHQQVLVPHSNLKLKLAEKLQQLGYLNAVELSSEKLAQQITLTLKYQDKLPVISSIKRISKPGRRVYTKSHGIKPVLSGFGATIITTSQGIFTDKEAKQKGLGGEIICQVW